MTLVYLREMDDVDVNVKWDGEEKETWDCAIINEEEGKMADQIWKGHLGHFENLND
jgi:hypothetical protein